MSLFWFFFLIKRIKKKNIIECIKNICLNGCERNNKNLFLDLYTFMIYKNYYLYNM